MELLWTRESLWAVAIVIRTLPAIAFSSIAELLAHRVEVSTPVNSFKRCEGSLFDWNSSLTALQSARRSLPL